VRIPGLGPMEAFPNGDALAYVSALGLDDSVLRNVGRFTLRWPGHCAIWRTLGDLRLLDEGAVTVDGTDVDRRRFLAAALEPELRYGPGERDLAIVRLEVVGLRGSRRERVVFQVIDRRDLATGFTAVSRLVGFAVSIGVHLIGSGRIERRGLLSPLTDVPFEPFARELARRGVPIEREVTRVRWVE
jgi:lysine 6-dehydrogenase